MADEARSLSPEELEPITPQQQRFVDEYLVDLNATQAAIRAGYSPASAHVQGCQLLKVPKIRARIDLALAERSKRIGINADRVLIELARIALVNPAQVINDQDATLLDSVRSDDTAAIQSIKVKVIPQRPTRDNPTPEPIIEREVRFHDKTKALELLGKHLGMFVDKHEISGPDGGTLTVKLEGEAAKWAK